MFLFHNIRQQMKSGQQCDGFFSTRKYLLWRICHVDDFVLTLNVLFNEKQSYFFKIINFYLFWS